MRAHYSHVHYEKSDVSRVSKERKVAQRNRKCIRSSEFRVQSSEFRPTFFSGEH